MTIVFYPWRVTWTNNAHVLVCYSSYCVVFYQPSFFVWSLHKNAFVIYNQENHQRHSLKSFALICQFHSMAFPSASSWCNVCFCYFVTNVCFISIPQQKCALMHSSCVTDLLEFIGSLKGYLRVEVLIFDDSILFTSIFLHLVSWNNNATDAHQVVLWFSLTR